MSRKPTPLQFDASVVSQLACPACHRGLRLDGSRLACAGCGRAYPIVDGIPVLIIGRSEMSLNSQ